jgi:hypothetical protein
VRDGMGSSGESDLIGVAGVLNESSLVD